MRPEQAKAIIRWHYEQLWNAWDLAVVDELAQVALHLRVEPRAHLNARLTKVPRITASCGRDEWTFRRVPVQRILAQELRIHRYGFLVLLGITRGAGQQTWRLAPERQKSALSQR